jgi:hypothetical protein
MPAQVVRVYFLWQMQVVGRRLFRAQDAQYKPRKDHKSWLELTEPLVLYDAVYGKFAKRAKGAAVNVPAVVLECVQKSTQRMVAGTLHDNVAECLSCNVVCIVGIHRLILLSF